MANPLAALGRALVGGGDGGGQAKDLWEAIRIDDAGAVSHFLSRGSDVNERGPEGWTPVQAACWDDCMKALGELLKHRPNLDAKDDTGRTAVELAAFQGSDRCLRRILHAGADANAIDQHGLTAMHKAAVTGHLACIRTLLEYNADVERTTPDGLTAAHLAAWKGQREALRLLASHRADMNARAADGGTPLHEAVRSGDSSTVHLLLQLGGQAGITDKFGRRPQDIAFAAGNREIFIELHRAAQAAPEATEQDLPDPSEFWKYIENAAGPADESVDVPLPPQRKAPEPKAPHPREEFEKWLGGLLFPQRARRVEERRAKQEAAAGAPYSRMHAPEVQDAPRMRPKPARQSFGSAGGSQFAQKRAGQAPEATAAPQGWAGKDAKTADDDWAPQANVRTGLEPYGAQGQQGRQQGGQGGPLGGLMQAIGNKAQQDIKTTMNALGGGGRGGPPESENARAGAGQGPPVATEGDSDFYDSDDFDVAEFDAKVEKKETEEQAAKDPWGMGRYRKPVTDSQGRLMSVAEARAQLRRMDEATTRAQGWLRGRDAARRLEAMKTLAAAQHEKQERAEARNPLQIIMDALWQKPRPQQEEEQLAVRDHLDTTVANTNIYGQASAKKPVPVPEVTFSELWRATQGFDQKSLLLQDTYGKVYQADVLGGMHAIRVLDSRRYTPDELSEFLTIAASLRHAHIVGLKGACPDRGILVHELPESGNVLYLLQTGSMPSSAPMQWNDAVDIALAVASALQSMHNRTPAIAHSGLTAAAVLVDRNGVAKVSDAGLFALCTPDAPHGPELLTKDIHCLGEVLMQLLTLNTDPIDATTRQRIIDYVDGGNHIGASKALGWPTQYSQAFERLAVACLKAGPATRTADLLRDTIVPGLLDLRGDTLTSLFSSMSTGSATPSAPPSVDDEEPPAAPAAFRCPLTQQVMLDPVLAGDGFIYERGAIEQWLSMGRSTSPMTNEPLPHKYLTAQRQLRASIERWLQAQRGAPVFA